MKASPELRVPNPEAGEALPGNTILIAEDDPVFRHILESCLQRWNYRVMAVANGLDAWNALQVKDAPQMALLDWVMPGMNGIELCRKIRDIQGPYRYLLLLTARDNKQDVVAGLEAGADDYLTKPFDVAELRARVRAGKRILDLQEALLRAHGALQFEAMHDPLTGILNRAAILDLLKKEVQRGCRTGEPLGLMMADLDFFKKVNDSYGHLVGDAVLRESARRMVGAVRGYDAVGRYGGEEFLILAPGCDAANLLTSGERLRRAVSSKPMDTEAGQVFMTVSIGLVSAPAAPGLSSDENLLRAADQALYGAKAKGRNRVEMALQASSAAQGG